MRKCYDYDYYICEFRFDIDRIKGGEYPSNKKLIEFYGKNFYDLFEEIDIFVSDDYDSHSWLCNENHDSFDCVKWNEYVKNMNDCTNILWDKLPRKDGLVIHL